MTFVEHLHCLALETLMDYRDTVRAMQHKEHEMARCKRYLDLLNAVLEHECPADPLNIDLAGI